MADTRKNIKAVPVVKDALSAIQKELNVKTEGQALAYLTALYRLQLEEKKISLSTHQKLLRLSEEITRQASF